MNDSSPLATEDTAIERQHHNSHRAASSVRLQRPEDAAARRAQARRKRLRRIPSLGVRLTALAVFLAAILVGMVGLTLKAIRPYHEAGAQTRRLTATRRQIADLDRQNDALQRQIANLNTPDGVASVAHSMGYLRPGENPLVVEGVAVPSAADADSPAVAPPLAPLHASLLSRFWHHLQDL